MEDLKIYSVDDRVLIRLCACAANNGRTNSEEAKDILSRAVGIEPNSGFPPFPTGVEHPCVFSGFEPPKPHRMNWTVHDVPQRLMGKIKAAAARNKRTVSSEARAMIVGAVGYDPPLPKGVVSGYEVFEKIFGPLRGLGIKPLDKDELYGTRRKARA